MCIRALDYCPPVDITFGDYLRAIITADSDLVPEDDHGYRIAFIEAFRRRGIYPRDVRTLSIESLRWPGVREDEDTYSNFEPIAARLRRQVGDTRYLQSRRDAYMKTRAMSAQLHELIRTSLDNRQQFEAVTGLVLAPDTQLPGLRKIRNEKDGVDFPVFEVHSVRPATRIGPDGDIVNQVIIAITQKREIRIDEASPTDDRTFVFRGGCTLILDLDTLSLRYRILKPVDDPQRLERQRKFMQEGAGRSLRATYFGMLDRNNQSEPFALLHRAF
jgi:hypothetical protein